MAHRRKRPRVQVVHTRPRRRQCWCGELLAVCRLAARRAVLAYMDEPTGPRRGGG